MTSAATNWDTSKLTPVTAGRWVYRAIDNDHIQGWNETEGRWIIVPEAMTVDQITPGDRSWHGFSVFVEDLLASRCGALPGQELVFMQTHTAQHGCGADWTGGIVVKLDAGALRAMSFGVGESPSDGTCSQTNDAHASLWKDPAWSKGQARAKRSELLKLMGQSSVVVYESPERKLERAGRTSGAPTPTTP